RTDSQCLTPSIDTCAKGGQWSEALNTLSDMSTAGVTPTVINYNSAIAACAKRGKWEEALELLSEMRMAGLTPD
ncbi:unnamed protein product, partial [Ectocarpus sp. 13 AM-2016]